MKDMQITSIQLQNTEIHHPVRNICLFEILFGLVKI